MALPHPPCTALCRTTCTAGATSSGCFNAPGAGPLLAFTSAGMVAAEEEEVENATGEVERFFTVEVGQEAAAVLSVRFGGGKGEG